MLVKYTEELGIRVVPVSPVDGIMPATTVVMLTPGWNEIPHDVWPHVEATMEDGLKDGTFEYQAKEVEEDGQIIRKPLELSELRADRAKNVIMGCFNPKTLKDWSMSTKISSELRATADLQIKTIADQDHV